MSTQNSATDDVECIPSQKWVRVYFNGRLIADSQQCILLRSTKHPAEYYFPIKDVDMQYLAPIKSTSSNEKQQACWDVCVGEKHAAGAAHGYPNLHELPALDGYLCLDWNSMDAWFEEQEEIFVHPRDPKVRLDVLHSNRHVKVLVQGETVAESRNPVLLFESGLPVRYYLPKTDVRQELLVPSQLVTCCPYKGEANYYSIKVGDYLAENVVWYYKYPTVEAAKIANYLAFYEEKIDSIEVSTLLHSDVR